MSEEASAAKLGGQMQMNSAVIEAAVRIGLIAALFLTCLAILWPFVTVIAWGGILAVAFNPVIDKLTESLNGRRKLAATIFTVGILAVLIVPMIMFASSSFEAAGDVYGELQEGTLQLPPPPDNVANWPLVGDKVHLLWTSASDNLEAVLRRYKKEVASGVTWLAGSVGSAIGGMLQFGFSIIIAGVFLATSRLCSAGTGKVARRFFGKEGDEFIELTTGTIRSVAQGVVGIAIIQCVLSAMGLFAVGVPAAGVWALLVLLLAIVQLPPILVLGPIMLYVFSVESTTTAVLFTIWSLFAGGCDTILKPMLLGRGVDVPMLVILMGAIGGMILSGIIGLFVGSVVLALGYKLFVEWLDRGAAAA